MSLKFAIRNGNALKLPIADCSIFVKKNQLNDTALLCCLSKSVLLLSILNGTCDCKMFRLEMSPINDFVETSLFNLIGRYINC